MSDGGVTAIVVSYHTGPVLTACIEALLRAPGLSKLILVDNGNPADMRAWIDETAETETKVSVIHPGKNLGFGAAVNLGAKAVERGDILIINPDAVIQDGAIAALQDTGADLRAPWIVGGRIEDETGIEQRGGRRRALTLFRAVTSFAGFKTWTLHHLPPPAAPGPIPVISGAFFLTSAESFRLLDGFDEGYFLHVEDVDLCKRCADAGGQVFYDPRASVIHEGGSSDAPSRIVAKHKADGLIHYFKRHARGPMERFSATLLLPIAKWFMLLGAK